MTGRRPMLDPARVIFEFVRVGASVKVTAVDPDSLTEIAIVGAANMPKRQLERAALARLEYVLRRGTKPAS